MGNWEMDLSQHAEVNKKGRVVQAKVNSEFLEPFWVKIRQAARRKRGAEPIFLCLDHASAHCSVVTVKFPDVAQVYENLSLPDCNAQLLWWGGS